MKKIMKKIRKFILNRKIEKYDLEMKDLDWEANLYHQMILRGIKKGISDVELDRLRLERDKIVKRHLQIIENQTDMLRRLRVA